MTGQTEFQIGKIYQFLDVVTKGDTTYLGTNENQRFCETAFSDAHVFGGIHLFHTYPKDAVYLLFVRPNNLEILEDGTVTRRDRSPNGELVFETSNPSRYKTLKDLIIGGKPR